MFVDTSALLAVVYARDANHGPANRLWAEVVPSGEPLVSTNYVLLETIALAQRRFGMAAVDAFSMRVAPSLEIEWVDQELHRAGVAAVLAANRRQLSLVDCVSFEVMRRRGLRQAFAFDHDFIDQGFECVP